MGRVRGIRWWERPARPAPAPPPRGPPEPHWDIIDSLLVMMLNISGGFSLARWLSGLAPDPWLLGWQLQLVICWSPYWLRKHVPLPLLGVPLERGYQLAAVLLPAQPVRWLCPDLWLWLLLLWRIGLVLPWLVAARLTELRAATMQSFPESWQPDQQIITTVVKL